MSVALAVIFHRVAAPHDLLREFRIALDALSHAKEARVGAMAGELRQNLRCDLRIGAVIDGDRHLAALRAMRRQAGPVGAQQVASRP